MLLNCGAEEDSWESLVFTKEIKPVNPKGNQCWIFIGRMDAKAEVPILWPSDAKSRLTGKDSDAGKDWEQEKKGMTEDEMVGWHHWLNEHEFEQTLGDGEGQRSLAWCCPWGHKKSDTTELLNNNTPFNSHHSLIQHRQSSICVIHRATRASDKLLQQASGRPGTGTQAVQLASTVYAFWRMNYLT